MAKFDRGQFLFSFLNSRQFAKFAEEILLTWIFLGLHAARAVTFQIADLVEFSKIIELNAVLTTNATINT